MISFMRILSMGGALNSAEPRLDTSVSFTGIHYQYHLNNLDSFGQTECIPYVMVYKHTLENKYVQKIIHLLVGLQSFHGSPHDWIYEAFNWGRIRKGIFQPPCSIINGVYHLMFT